VNTGALTQLVIAAAGLVTAVGALLHSVQTRRQVNAPTTPPAQSNTTTKP
jgi:hypothetical protein